MSPRPKLLTPEVARELTERLARIPSVHQFDQPGEPQAATIVHSLSDLEESFRTTLDVLLPKLLDVKLAPAEISDVLLDVGEELRHVLYHIKDPKFFAYLLERDA